MKLESKKKQNKKIRKALVPHFGFKNHPRENFLFYFCRKIFPLFSFWLLIFVLALHRSRCRLLYYFYDFHSYFSVFFLFFFYNERNEKPVRKKCLVWFSNFCALMEAVK